MSQEPDIIRKLLEAVPEDCRKLINLSALSFPIDDAWLVSSFGEAVRSIRRAVTWPVPSEVLIGTSPLSGDTRTHKLTVELKEDVIAFTTGHFIYLDWQRLLRYVPSIRTACILEEFVHLWMNVSDEDLVTRIVCALYSGVRYENGQYWSVLQTGGEKSRRP